MKGTEGCWSHLSAWGAAVRFLRGVVSGRRASAAPAGATAEPRCGFHFQAERHVCAASRLQLRLFSPFPLRAGRSWDRRISAALRRLWQPGYRGRAAPLGVSPLGQPAGAALRA